MQSLLADWGLHFDAQVASDSSAARGHVQRRGLGKARHIQTRYLWIQERVGEGHVKIVAVPGKVNDSDILTKAVSGADIRRALMRLGFDVRDKSLLQKETKTRKHELAICTAQLSLTQCCEFCLIQELREPARHTTDRGTWLARISPQAMGRLGVDCYWHMRHKTHAETRAAWENSNAHVHMRPILAAQNSCRAGVACDERHHVVQSRCAGCAPSQSGSWRQDRRAAAG